MKPILLQVEKHAIFPQKIQHLVYGLHKTLTLIFGIYKDVIQIYNDKNIELFGQNLVNIGTEAGRSIR